MKLSRALVASLALPAALSLAACGGSNSTTVGNVVGQQSQLRFVNGSPGAGSVDVYYNTTGTSATTTPLTYATGLAYGSITDFQPQVVGASQVFVRAAGSPATSTTIVGSCNLPQPGNNEKDTVVFVNSNSGSAGTAVTCAIFKDFDYNASSGGQYRVHHASPAAAAAGLTTVSFGSTNAGTVPPAPFTIVSTATFPGTTTSNPSVGFASTGVNGPITSLTTPVGFAIGSGATNSGTTASVAEIDASKFVAPGTTTQPDTAGTLPGGGFNNASIFAIDCNTATTPQGSKCAGGVGLIGSFDSK